MCGAGKLHPLPKGKGGKGPKGQLELVFGSNGVLKFGLAGELLSWPGKIRAAIGALVGHLPPPEGKEETIREWVTRTLGEEVFLRVISTRFILKQSAPGARQSSNCARSTAM